MPIIPYLSSYLHTIPCVYPSFAVYGYDRLRASPYIYKNVFRGTERKQRTTQKHIENHHWELLQTRVMALLPSLLHFSLETPPEDPHDAAAALSLFICKV